MPRRLLILYLALLSVVGCAPHYRPAQMPSPSEHVAPAQASRSTAPPHVLALGGIDPQAFYANLRAANQFWVTDPTFAGGAVGDCSNDDTAAQQAAINKAIAVQGTPPTNAGGEVYWPTPPCAYKTTSELLVNGPARLRGQSSNGNTAGIRAYAAMRSVLALRCTFGITNANNTVLGYDRCRVSDLTVDANFQSLSVTQPTHGILQLGVESSQFDNVHAINSLGAGIYAAKDQFPMTIGSVTTTGSNTFAGLTVTQPDPNYESAVFAASSCASGTCTIVVKANSTTTFQVSYDGGSTYYSYVQNITPSSASNLTINGLVLSGFRVVFPAGPFTINDTARFTITYSVLGDFGGLPGAPNADDLFQDVGLSQDGTLYRTAGMPPAGLINYNLVVAPGTVALTSGSGIVAGTSTTFMSQFGASSSRQMITIDGVLNTYGTRAIFQSIILNDAQQQIVVGTEPAVNVSGKNYATGGFGCYYESGLGDGARMIWNGGQLGQCVNGLFFAGGHGPHIVGMSANSVALGGLIVGGGISPFDYTTTTLVENWHTASGCANPFYLSPNSGGQLLEPTGTVIVDGVPISWSWETNGVYTPLFSSSAFSLVPLTNFQLIPQAVTLAAHNSTIPAPTAYGLPLHNSLIRLSSTPTGLVNLDGLTIGPGVNGQKVQIINVQPGTTYAFNDNQTNLSAVTGIYLSGASTVNLGYLEFIEFTYMGPEGIWIQTGFGSHATYPGGQIRGGGKTIVTSNSTLTELYRTRPTTGLGIANGIGIRFLIHSEATTGTLEAWWTGTASWDGASNLTGFTIDSAAGTNSGAPPSGWGPTGAGGDGFHGFINWQATANNSSPITTQIMVDGISGP
jgi:hypothetical protein